MTLLDSLLTRRALFGSAPTLPFVLARDAAAAQIGLVNLGAGSHGDLTIDSGQSFDGQGCGATVVRSVTSAGFWDVVDGTPRWQGNSPTGPTNIALRRFRVQGSPGNGVNLYAPAVTIDGLIINDNVGHGLYSRWSTDLGENAPPDFMEGLVSHVKSYQNGGAGIWWDGAHDLHGAHWEAIWNDGHGIVVMERGGALRLVNGHAWGNKGWAFYVNGAGCQLTNCTGESQTEGCFALLQPSIKLVNAVAFSTPDVEVTGFHIAGDGVKVLNAEIVDCARPVVWAGTDYAEVTGTIQHPFDLGQYPVFQGDAPYAVGALWDLDRHLWHRWPAE
jgi:hypothetical protein